MHAIEFTRQSPHDVGGLGIRISAQHARAQGRRRKRKNDIMVVDDIAIAVCLIDRIRNTIQQRSRRGITARPPLMPDRFGILNILGENEPFAIERSRLRGQFEEGGVDPRDCRPFSLHETVRGIGKGRGAVQVQDERRRLLMVEWVVARMIGVQTHERNAQQLPERLRESVRHEGTSHSLPAERQVDRRILMHFRDRQDGLHIERNHVHVVSERSKPLLPLSTEVRERVVLTSGPVQNCDTHGYGDRRDFPESR
ncbi:MAG: hypothetical protein INH04_13570 [Gemmatimonas sp.]|nr:hypothetical protein [Gemmatimonas sp.]MCA2986108.1 hypothetical protein [Gemmatimonas sp.]MCA2993781.1 hypothetical protein [Gemmatimonas sp.]